MIPGKKFDKKFFTSDAYKDYREILDAWVGPVARKIYGLLKSKPAPRVLDIGCGFGDLLAELQDRYNFSVAGLEVSQYAIDKACPSVKSKIKKGGILKLPFKRNSFDVVVCFDVIYYLTLKETVQAIKNLINVSRNYIFFNSIYRHSIYSSQRENPDPLRITVLSKKEYINLFEKNGVKLIKTFLTGNGGETLVFRKIKHNIN
ncbi:MAG: class I SAM-dependent methyltransferase [bacterium]|nr:class I SAM-dependent methyltransferase [bacterium]